MANPEHLAMLEQGVAKWNPWKAERRSLVVDLTGADLSNRVLNYVELENADLTRADLTQSEFMHSRLRGSKLVQATLRSAHLMSADLKGATLTMCSLWGAYLADADFRHADLSDADISRAELGRADFTGAVLTRTRFNNAKVGLTSFGGSDLSKALGLETLLHTSPSTIGIDTLLRANGKIPEAFFRGAGLPDNVIAYAASLAASAIQFYSCFISFSTKDQQFADRLYADLQSHGVRCWFAPEDLKIGDPFRQRIDESIRLHDRLLLILSENSVQSPWVLDEVEAALERERRENRLVLFPIRIDDAIMQTDKAWAASIRRTRHIGDFSRWKEHDSYTKAFQRLLKDLKAEPAAAP